MTNEYKVKPIDDRIDSRDVSIPSTFFGHANKSSPPITAISTGHNDEV